MEAARHTLYKVYGENRELLYVGITSRGIRRMKQHAVSAAWWEDVSTIEVEHFDSRVSVCAAEKREIAERGPRHNIRGRVPKVPKKKPEPRKAFQSSRLVEARLNRGYSQTELAMLAGVSPDSIAKIEAGARTNPHPRTLRKLAGALGIEIRELRDDRGD